MTRYVNNHWSLLDEMDRSFKRLWGEQPVAAYQDRAWSPAVDIIEDTERFVMMLDIPGVDPESIDISVEESVMTIKGSRHTADLDEKAGYRRRERRLGNFERSFNLPETVHSEEISASEKFGVLEVVIPKKPADQPRRIPVTH